MVRPTLYEKSIIEDLHKIIDSDDRISLNDRVQKNQVVLAKGILLIVEHLKQYD